MASYFTERKSGAIRIEGTEGTFETPLAADMKFPSVLILGHRRPALDADLSPQLKRDRVGRYL